MTLTTPPPADRLPAATLLFDPLEQATDALTRALTDQGLVARVSQALPRVSGPATQLLRERLAEVAADLLADIDVADVVVTGWRKHAALVEAARRTMEDPDSEELVDLAAHRIASVHRPQIDVIVDHGPVVSVEFELRIEMVVRGVIAHVRNGRLAGVEGGRCRLSASLACCGFVVAARDTELELGAVIDFGSGIPLVWRPDLP